MSFQPLLCNVVDRRFPEGLERISVQELQLELRCGSLAIFRVCFFVYVAAESNGSFVENAVPVSREDLTSLANKFFRIRKCPV
jgi:hypothetical protein